MQFSGRPPGETPETGSVIRVSVLRLLPVWSDDGIADVSGLLTRVGDSSSDQSSRVFHPSVC